MTNKDTAARVLDLRKTLGLTQEGLARKLGVTTSSVYRWEKGLARPSHLALAAIKRLRTRSQETADGEL
jgi:type I restriction enzyme M protein